MHPIILAISLIMKVINFELSQTAQFVIDPDVWPRAERQIPDSIAYYLQLEDCSVVRHRLSFQNSQFFVNDTTIVLLNELPLYSCKVISHS